jgi:uncharacterized protein YjiS (DUF1127 family)
MKQHHCTHPIGQVPGLPAEPAPLGGLWLAWLASWLRHLPDDVLLWLERARQRRRLGGMDDRTLRDIGVSRSAAFAETRKWFWQP